MKTTLNRRLAVIFTSILVSMNAIPIASNAVQENSELTATVNEVASSEETSVNPHSFKIGEQGYTFEPCAIDGSEIPVSIEENTAVAYVIIKKTDDEVRNFNISEVAEYEEGKASEWSYKQFKYDDIHPNDITAESCYDSLKAVVHLIPVSDENICKYDFYRDGLVDVRDTVFMRQIFVANPLNYLSGGITASQLMEKISPYIAENDAIKAVVTNGELVCEPWGNGNTSTTTSTEITTVVTETSTLATTTKTIAVSEESTTTTTETTKLSESTTTKATTTVTTTLTTPVTTTESTTTKLVVTSPSGKPIPDGVIKTMTDSAEYYGIKNYRFVWSEEPIMYGYSLYDDGTGILTDKLYQMLPVSYYKKLMTEIEWHNTPTEYEDLYDYVVWAMVYPSEVGCVFSHRTSHIAVTKDQSMDAMGPLYLIPTDENGNDILKFCSDSKVLQDFILDDGLYGPISFDESSNVTSNDSVEAFNLKKAGLKIGNAFNTMAKIF